MPKSCRVDGSNRLSRRSRAGPHREMVHRSITRTRSAIPRTSSATDLLDKRQAPVSGNVWACATGHNRGCGAARRLADRLPRRSRPARSCSSPRGSRTGCGRRSISVLDRQGSARLDGGDRASSENFGGDCGRLYPAGISRTRLRRVSHRSNRRAHLRGGPQDRLSLCRPKKPGLEPLLYENRVRSRLRVAAFPQGNYRLGEPFAMTNIAAASDANYYIDRWLLTPEGNAIVTRTSHLLPVRWQGVAAVLKIAVDAEEELGNELMAWWNGQGVPLVLAQEGKAILLERAQEVGSLAGLVRRGRDDDVTRIICAVVGKLHL